MYTNHRHYNQNTCEPEIWLKRQDRIVFHVPTACTRIQNDIHKHANGIQKHPAPRREVALFFQQASLHGLLDIYRAQNRPVRILWILIFFGALAAAVFGCCAIVDAYREAPIVASYFINGMNEKHPLPDLIICPFNRFNLDFLKNHSIPDEVAQFMQLSFGAITQHPYQRRALQKFYNVKRMNNMTAAMNETLSRLNMSFGEFLDLSSLKCEDIIMTCTLPNGGNRCCENATDLMTFTGKCYRIPAANQSGVGYGYGATLVISLPKLKYTLSVNNWLNDGVILQLAEPGRAVDTGMTFLSTGTHALMPLKATRFQFMHDPPHFECLEHAPMNYGILDCFENCVTEEAEASCGCSIVTKLYRPNSRPACTTAQFYFCIVNYMQLTLGEDEKRQTYFYACRQRCKPRCDYWQYYSAMSYANFPFQEARTFARNELEWRRMRNTIILDIYYEKLEYTLIKHHPSLSVHGFIANLGGQYSLWLGGSILTLIQVLVFVVRYFYLLAKEKMLASI